MTSGAEVVEYTRSLLGKPYDFGAEGPNAFDCSGLIQYAYKHFGLSTPRTTYDMVGSSKLQTIAAKDLQAGDLIFSSWDGKAHSHVAMYTGDGHVIEAPEPGKNVMVSTFGPQYRQHADAYRRVPGIAGSASPSTPTPGTSGTLANPLGALGAAGAGLFTAPANLVEAATNIGTSLVGVAQGAAEVGALAGLVTKAFLPSNLMRGACLMFGTIFILIGIWFLAREVKEA